MRVREDQALVLPEAAETPEPTRTGAPLRQDSYTPSTNWIARNPSSPAEIGLRFVRIASAKSRNCRSNGASEIAIGSDAPEATSRSSGGGSPKSFSTSQVVSLSPEITAVP